MAFVQVPKDLSGKTKVAFNLTKGNLFVLA